MKKRICVAVLALTLGLCAGCGSRNAESNMAGDNSEIDFTRDYSEDIKKDVDDAIAASASFQEEITKNRAYVLANELAKVEGETFEMPERSTKYGVFADNQGTGSVYSLLCTQQGVNGSDEAVISIYRQGELKGSFVDNGNGELEFSSGDGSVKGIIQINGWDGASFEVTETSNPDAFPVGQKTEFPFAF